MTNRIQSLRRRRGMTLKHLADAVGTTASTISKLEKGQRRLTVDWMRKIAEVLQVAPHELIDMAGETDGLRENAEPYEPAPGGPLQPVAHFLYMRMLNDDLAEHPDGIREGSVVCFDLNVIDRAAIAPGKVVLVTMFSRTELNRQHGLLVGQFMPPNKLCSNRASGNWMINLDDDALPYEPVVRGVLRFVIRDMPH